MSFHVFEISEQYMVQMHTAGSEPAVTLKIFLNQIIMHRYKNWSGIIISSPPMAEWGKFIDVLSSSTAIMDRFLHHPEIINIKGKNCRLKNRA